MKAHAQPQRLPDPVPTLGDRLRRAEREIQTIRLAIEHSGFRLLRLPAPDPGDDDGTYEKGGA